MPPVQCAAVSAHTNSCVGWIHCGFITESSAVKSTENTIFVHRKLLVNMKRFQFSPPFDTEMFLQVLARVSFRLREGCFWIRVHFVRG